MKTLILIIGFAITFSCSSTTNKAVVSNPEASAPKDAPLPACVQKMIEGYKSEEKQNPPRQIYSYQYKGKTVYYVTPPCCDFFSDLFDSDCNLMGHPDGGITGRGEGKITDFAETRTEEKLIWKDSRK